MELEIIEVNVDQSKEIYASTKLPEVDKFYDRILCKIGFNKPWVGYFTLNQQSSCWDRQFHRATQRWKS